MIHTCPDCGLIHDHVQPPAESPEVAIARIQAQSAEAIAKINARSDRDWNESREAVAEIEADAQVDAAETEAAVIAAAIEAGAVAPESTEPVIIDAPAAEPDDDPEELPPVDAGDGSPAPAPSGKKSLGLGMW